MMPESVPSVRPAGRSAGIRRLGTGVALAATVGLLGTSVTLVQRTQHLEGELRTMRSNAPDVAVVERMAAILADNQGVNPATILGMSLRPATGLAGASRAVPADLAADLAGATVRLGIQPRASRASEWEPGWNEWCTGTLVTHENRTYVLTAAHCFDEQLVLDDVDWERTDADVREVSRQLGHDYAILDPAQPSPTPLVRLGKVAMPVNQRGDWALASVTGRIPSPIGAIPLELVRDPSPTVGEAVGQHTYSSRTYGSPIDSDGVYVGRSEDVISGRSSDIELVAIDPLSAEQDACFYGASGSSAVLASGRVTGPLSVRSSIGYGPAREIDPQDADGGRWQRLQLEDATQVDLSEVTIVCGYSAYDPYLLDSILGLLA